MSTQVRYRHAKKDTVNSGSRWGPEKLQNLACVKQTSPQMASSCLYNEMISEETRTVTISAHGAMILLTAKVSVGQLQRLRVNHATTQLLVTVLQHHSRRNRHSLRCAVIAILDYSTHLIPASRCYGSFNKIREGFRTRPRAFYWSSDQGPKTLCPCPFPVSQHAPRRA